MQHDLVLSLLGLFVGQRRLDLLGDLEVLELKKSRSFVVMPDHSRLLRYSDEAAELAFCLRHYQVQKYYQTMLLRRKELLVLGHQLLSDHTYSIISNLDRQMMFNQISYSSFDCRIAVRP